MKNKNYRKELSDAVSFFWNKRLDQANKQGSSSGKKDTGNRSSVTGGAQLDGFVNLFATIAKDTGLTDSQIFINETTLPGYYRPTKEWDIVLYNDGDLIATIELKSHIGPSFGNNFNNRVEEALGSATDLKTAFREGVLKNSIKPWMGYFMLLEDHLKSSTHVKAREPFFEVMPEFKQASYRERYIEFCKRLVSEHLYDSSCLLFSNVNEGLKGKYTEPSPSIDFIQFASSLIGKIAGYIKNKEMRK